MSSEAIRIGIAGLGTVGAGVVKILTDNADILAERCGKPLDLAAVSARERNRERGIDLTGVDWVDAADGLAERDDIDVVVELIGGSDGVAHRLAETSLKSGKHFVTANKALIAHHGEALAQLAEENNVTLAFEGAVAAGIPVIKALRESLTANRLTRIYGILNGTCNYILTAMERTGRDFDSVLLDAQAKGYAEANPSFDVDGIDTAHKLAIMAAVAFGCRIDFDQVHIEGVRQVNATDIAYAAELGYRIKLLGIARLTEHGIEKRVHPCMVPIGSPIAYVDDVFNAIVAEGDFVDRAIFEGRGAGEGPTASAVVGDLIDIGRGLSTPAFSVPIAGLREIAPAPMGEHIGPYYMRLHMADEPGVIADIANVLKEEEISLESILQHGTTPDGAAIIALITHQAREHDMTRAVERIGSLATALEPPTMIRIEEF